MIRQGLHIIAGSPSPNINEKKAIELTKSAYEQLVADGLVEEDQNYIIIDDEAPNIIDDTLSSYDNVYSAAHTLGLINTLKENVYTKSETESVINRKLISAIKYKGKVAEVENLPSLAENGDAYYVTGESLLYIYNEDLANYEALGDIADLSAYLTEEEILELLKEKNIKFQYAEMPEASSEFDYPIQYIGATTENYKLGSWYRSVSNSGTYTWEELLIEGKNKDPFETDTIPETAENGTTHLYIGADNANYKKGHVYQYNDSSWNDITAGTIQLKTLPTANENELNKIYQYIGVSNSNYTNGYFYECVESNNSYTWAEKEVQKNNDVPHWTGTHAEYEAVKDTLPDYTILHFTDDYEDSVGVVDKIEDNNMNGVTSNAVYDALPEIYNKQLTVTPYEQAQLYVGSAYLRGQKVRCKDGRTFIFGKIVLNGNGNPNGGMNLHPCKLTGFPGPVTFLTARLPCLIWSGWTGFYSMDVVDVANNVIAPIIAGPGHQSSEEACFTPTDVIVEVTQ